MVRWLIEQGADITIADKYGDRPYTCLLYTSNGRLITGYACDSRTADAEFLLAKRLYITATGRVRGAVSYTHLDVYKRQGWPQAGAGPEDRQPDAAG